MFEQIEEIEEPEKTPKVSAAMTVGILTAYLAGAIGGFLLLITLDDRPFGIEIVTAIMYTYFAFWYTFYPTRGMLEKYNLGDERIQKQIPRLLLLHSAFLILLLLGQIKWFAMKPNLPSYWVTEYGKKKDSWAELVEIGIPVIIFFTQVLISRGILGRSLAQSRDAEG